MAIGKVAIRERAKRVARFLSGAIGLARSRASRARSLLRPGAMPGRYWPVALIASALAEAVHAPLVSNALAALNHAPGASAMASTPKESARPAENTSDLQAPTFLDFKPLVESDDRYTSSLALPRPSRIHNEPVLPHSTIDPILTGGGGVSYFDPGGGGATNLDPAPPREWNGIVNGGSGDVGPGAGDGGGTHSPVVYGPNAPSSVPEPGGVSSLIFCGSALLGRKKRTPTRRFNLSQPAKSVGDRA